MTVEELVPDGLWAEIAPLLPTPPPRPKGGRRRVPYRNVVAGIIYVLRTGVPWRYVPARELGCGSGVTCWRRLVDWQQAGVWEQLHARLLDRANAAGGLDGSVASLDSTSVRAKRGGVGRRQSQRSRQAGLQVPPDRGRRRAGVGRAGVGGQPPRLAAASAVGRPGGPVRGRVGQPRRPVRLYADKAYDFSRCRRALRARGITARIARPGVQPSQRLGRHRWKVERTIAWLLEHRRLQVRYERLAAVLNGLLLLACALMCWRSLRILSGGR